MDQPEARQHHRLRVSTGSVEPGLLFTLFRWARQRVRSAKCNSAPASMRASSTVTLSSEALDLGLAGTIDTSFGVFSLRYTGTKYLKYETEEVYGEGNMIDVVGTLGFPEWRSNAQASWAWKVTSLPTSLGTTSVSLSHAPVTTSTTHGICGTRSSVITSAP